MNKLKRIIGFVLAFTVLISSVYISSFNIFADEGIIYWDGSIKAPSVGSGTETDPYIISEPSHFADIMKNVRGQNVYYKLTSNIYLNDISKINWTTGEAENGYDINTWTPSAFRGYIDGDGYSVYGLYINRKPSSYSDNNTNGTGAGLLTENWGSATVDFKNLGMDYVYIDSPNTSAAFVARQNSGRINFNSCYLGENVFIKGNSAGGFVGYGGTTTIIIKNSYCTTPAENIVAVGNAAKSGAFLGDVWTENTKSISGSYSVARLYGNQKPKGSSSNLTSCYSTVQKSGSDGVKILTTTQMQGSSAAVNMSAIGFESGIFVTTKGYPALKIFQKYTVNIHINDSETQSTKLFDWDTFADLDIPRRDGFIFQGFFADAALTQSVQSDERVKNYSDIYVKWREAPLDAKVWNGAVKEPTADSDDDGYIDIIYPSELAWVISNDAEGNYELNDDIYLNDITVDTQSGTYTNNSQYEPLQWYTKADKAFSGEINGNGHIVYGLFYDNGNESDLAAGLIPSVKKATVKNIGVDNSYIVQNSQFRVGAVVGTVHEADEVVIEECFVGENVYLEGTKIGGITGGGAPINVNKTVRVTIKNCYSLANINATQYGGIVGNLWSSYNRYYITGCYSSSRFSEGTSDLGSSSGNYAVGQEDGSRIIKLTLDDMQGALAEEKMSALFGENSAYMTTFGYPELRVFQENIVEYYISSTEKVHLGVSDTFTVGELEKPAKLGFTFDGFYTDAEFKNKAQDNALLKDYTAIYVKLDPITKGDKVYNTYDYEGATFTKIEQSDSRTSEGGTGNYYGTKSNMTASMENGQLSQFDAWVETGVGVGGSHGLKVTRARGYTWQWPTAVMLYDFDGSSFVPEKNSYYKISLKYKLSCLKEGKQIKIQLRQTVNGEANVKYENVFEYGLINQRRMDSNFVSDGWVNTSLKFATGEDVEALFIAFTTDNNVWYAEELELYIDDIVIEKITESQMNEEYISPDSKNTYDETDASFTKIRQSDTTEFYGTISNINAYTENGQLSAYNAWVESGVGVNGSNALKVIRAEGYENRWPAAVMLYDSNFNSFVPETNSYYKITLKYKVKSLKEGKQIRIQLRQTVNGKISEYYENVAEYGTVNQKIIDNYSVSDNWVETTFKFATDSDVQALFLAFTTENNKYWAEELELYIDDISIDKITKEEMYEAYVSPVSKNTYDEEDIIYTKYEQSDKKDYGVEGNFFGTKNNMGVTAENGLFSQYDAWVESGAGVDGSNALKVIRAHGYEKQWPAAVMLYDSNYNGFTPKANSYYQIKLKYKVDSLKDGKLVNIRLRQKVDGKVNVKYENIVEYGTVNRKNIDIFSLNQGWIETSFTFATDSQVDELYLAITSDNNQWWAEELELYIDDIEIKEITKDEMVDYSADGSYVSGDSKNTYDEEDAQFIKIEQKDNRDYGVDGKFNATKSNLSAKAENGYFAQFDAWVESGAGVDGSNALKVIRAHGYKKQWPAAVMLYDSNYNGFIPKANSYYQIKLKYKVDSLKDGKLVNIRLRQKVDGKVNVPYENIVEYGTVNRKNIDIFAVSGGWIETSFTFATNSQVDELYLAITSDNNQWWAEELELYIDDIEIKEITKEEMVDYSADGSYVSGDSKNTYDEEDAQFMKIEQKDNRDYGVEGKFNATKSNMSAKTENGLFSQYDAWVESGAGVDGSNALKVIRAHGYEKQWPAAVMLYDDNFNNFVPKSNSFYQISLKYKVASLKEGKQVRLQLRGMVDGKVNVKYENIVEYGTINKKIIDNYSVSDNWVETTFKFATSEEVDALYIAVTSNNEKWWAEELELYIDDIEIKQITEDEYKEPYVSPDSKNTYDEKDITYTKFEQTDKRDYSVEGNFLGTKSNMGVVSEHGRFSQYDAFVEKGVGVDGTNALKVIRAHGYEKQYPTAVMLYDSNYNGFIPKANSYYQITLKYRIESLKEGKQVRIQLRQKVDGKVNVKYENVVDYGRVNEEIIDSTCVSDKWVEATFKFVTGDKVDELFLAFTTENNKYWAEELELYIDDIEIKQISYEEMGFDEGVKGRVWSGKVAMNYAGGKGTETEPYLIETPEQLAKCVSDAITTKTYYKVIADLKLNDTSSADWAKTAKEWIYDTENELVFRGHIDGDGHIVSGLYYNSTNGAIDCGALFPRVAGDAVIEKLGIIKSSVTVKNGQEQSYGAAFIAFVESYTKNGVAVGPKLSQCFADDTVNVESYYAGGLVCGVASYAPTTLENCYFTGKIFGNGSMGTLFGNSWTNDRNFSTITNCYASSPDRNKMITNNGIKTTNYTNVYIDSSADSPRPNGVTYTLLKFMKGDEAKKLMQGFDFDKIWKIVPNGTPVLSVFESTDYSCTREPSKVAIQFNSNGGSKCETIYGEAREKLPELPKPTKYGYEFGGWYYFFELDVPCDLEVFPDFNTILYAKWIPTGFTVDFEGKYDAVYDFNTSVQHHKPGSAGYRPMYNRNGMKSMQCMENSEINPVFLLSYENKLEVGKEYEMTVWINTATKGVSGNVELLFGDYPDISAPTIVSEAVVDVSDISANKWTEKKVKFVAQSPYIFFKTPLNATLYFDDIQVVPTGEDGNVDALSDGITSTAIVFIIIASVVLLGGIATIAVIIIKKRRKYSK